MKTIARFNLNRAFTIAALVLVLLAGAAVAAMAEDLRGLSTSVRLAEAMINEGSAAHAKKPDLAPNPAQLMQWILQRQGPVQIEGRDASAMGAAAPQRTPLQALQSLSTMKPQTDAQGKVVVHPLQSVTGR